MAAPLPNTKEEYVKMYYIWHRTFCRWMISVSKCDIETLKKELDAIEWKKARDMDSKYYIYKTELLNAQEAIVKRLIDEIQKNELDLTYDELDIIITTLQEYNYEDVQNGCIGEEELRNCKSGVVKLKTLMEKMKEEKVLKQC